MNEPDTANNVLELADIAEDAARVLDEEGWCQHELINLDNNLCLVGAIRRAANRTGKIGASTAVYLLGHAMRPRLDPTGHLVGGQVVFVAQPNLPEWNDAPGRTKEEVTALLQKTAAELREHVA